MKKELFFVVLVYGMQPLSAMNAEQERKTSAQNEQWDSTVLSHESLLQAAKEAGNVDTYLPYKTVFFNNPGELGICADNPFVTCVDPKTGIHAFANIQSKGIAHYDSSKKQWDIIEKRQPEKLLAMDFIDDKLVCKKENDATIYTCDGQKTMHVQGGDYLQAYAQFAKKKNGRLIYIYSQRFLTERRRGPGYPAPTTTNFFVLDCLSRQCSHYIFPERNTSLRFSCSHNENGQLIINVYAVHGNKVMIVNADAQETIGQFKIKDKQDESVFNGMLFDHNRKFLAARAKILETYDVLGNFLQELTLNSNIINVVLINETTSIVTLYDGTIYEIDLLTLDKKEIQKKLWFDNDSKNYQRILVHLNKQCFGDILFTGTSAKHNYITIWIHPQKIIQQHKKFADICALLYTLQSDNLPTPGMPLPLKKLILEYCGGQVMQAERELAQEKEYTDAHAIMHTEQSADKDNKDRGLPTELQQLVGDCVSDEYLNAI